LYLKIIYLDKKGKKKDYWCNFKKKKNRERKE